jgi:8-oxo-dGTP diphosphatase
MKINKSVRRPKVGIGIVVIKESNDETYVMLHRRTGTLGKNYWGSGGGHLELGESLRSAALRELREEASTKLKIKNVRFLGVINFTELHPEHYVDVSFVAEWVKGEPMNSALQKTTDWKWFPLNKLPKPLFPPVKIYLDFIKSGQKFHDSSFDAKR